MANFFNADEVDARLQQEFIEEVTDTMATAEVLLENLRSNTVSRAEALAAMKLHAHNLRFQARSSNIALLQIVTQRMDDYLANVHDLMPAQVVDLQAFVDKIGAIISGDLTETSSDAGAKLVRELPAKKTFLSPDFDVVIPKDVEVICILPERAMSHIVERELAACGLRSTSIRSPFEAFEQVMRTQPDVIIASMELGSINGVDLACAFAAMPKTRNIPFCLFTSYRWGQPILDGLPPRAAILRKGPEFGDDLAEALARFGIL